jgi:DNA-binding response OmpR family regulator
MPKGLIIEDDSDVRSLLSKLLRSEGYEILIAENGKVALDLLKQNPIPDFILLDLRMPQMDAVGFRKIQEMDPRIASIPVIVVSAEEDVDIKGLKLGLAYTVKKPIDIEHLLSTISLVLEKQRNCSAY